MSISLCIETAANILKKNGRQIINFFFIDSKSIFILLLLLFYGLSKFNILQSLCSYAELITVRILNFSSFVTGPHFSTVNWNTECSMCITFVMAKKIAALHSFSFFVLGKCYICLPPKKHHKIKKFPHGLMEIKLSTTSKWLNIHFCFQLLFLSKTPKNYLLFNLLSPGNSFH